MLVTFEADTRRSALLKHLAFARTLGHLSRDLGILRGILLWHSLIARIAAHIVAALRRAGIRHVVDAGRRLDDQVHHGRVGVHADVRLHADVLLAFFLPLVHLAVTLDAVEGGGRAASVRRQTAGPRLWHRGGCPWVNRRHKFRPRNPLVHLVKEFALAHPLGLVLASAFAKGCF